MQAKKFLTALWYRCSGLVKCGGSRFQKTREEKKNGKYFSCSLPSRVSRVALKSSMSSPITPVVEATDSKAQDSKFSPVFGDLGRTYVGWRCSKLSNGEDLISFAVQLEWSGPKDLLRKDERAEREKYFSCQHLLG